MKKEILHSLIVLLIAFAAGYFLFSASNEKRTLLEEEGMNSINNMSHTHAMLEVAPDAPLPQLSLEALEDSKDGYNLRLITGHFTFAPEHVNTEPVFNEGHAHIYVNGTKIARLYSDWFHLSASLLQEGENLIKVTLNANDHSEWMHAGVRIMASILIQKSL